MNEKPPTPEFPGSRQPDKPRAMMRLNIFQQLMRSWTSQGPYNAGQAMRIGGHHDIKRWQDAINPVIASIGLGIPQIQGDCVVFNADTRVLPQICDEALSAVTVREINKPFGTNEIPLRFFIIPDGDDHWLLTIYDHWVADSWTIRELMRLILACYAGVSANGQSPLHVTDDPFERLFHHRRGSITAPVRIFRAARRYFKHRRSWRFDLTDPLDFSAGLSMHALPEKLIGTLIAFSKSNGCSVNDIFLAAIAMAIGQLTTARRYKIRRRWWAGGRMCVSVGSIVDIRGLADQPLDHTFGLFLSSCINTFSKPEQQTLPDLIRRTARQTRSFKKHGGAVAAFGELAVVKYFSELYEQPRHKALFFQKNCPLLAGVSNVNLTGAWMEQSDGLGEMVQDYVRISPVGPLLPVVFALTTFRSRLNLCLTWRKAALTEPQAAELCTAFITLLGELRP